MVNESIEKIKQAEDAVKAMVKEVQAESDKIVREAREKAEKINDDTKKEASEKLRLVIKNAESEAEKEIALLKKENQAGIDGIRSIAESNRPKAASFIIGRIIG